MIRCRKPAGFALPCDLALGHAGECVPWVPHDDDWEADGGPESAPDHWRYEKDDDVTMTVWSKGFGASYVWEVWPGHTCGGPTDDERRGCFPCENPDEPTETGEVRSFDEAKRAAERAAALL